jgi:hypothetical protein
MSRSAEMEQQSNESVEALITALAIARAEMLRIERSLRHAFTSLDEGCTTMEEFVSAIRPHVEAERLADALEKVNEIRRESRRKVFSLALERGNSTVEMARVWGVRRQLAARYVHEAMSASGSG